MEENTSFQRLSKHGQGEEQKDAGMRGIFIFVEKGRE